MRQLLRKIARWAVVKFDDKGCDKLNSENLLWLHGRIYEIKKLTIEQSCYCLATARIDLEEINLTKAPLLK